MTTTFDQPGEILSFTAPTGGVVSGHAYVIGNLLVIATADAAEAATFECARQGVFELPRVDTEDWAEGDPIYFAADLSPDPLFTNVAGSPALRLVGVAVEDIPASPAAATGKVLLDGIAR